jgi:DNA-directed RNA polymerase subunit RPC12/RpoP
MKLYGEQWLCNYEANPAWCGWCVWADDCETEEREQILKISDVVDVKKERYYECPECGNAVLKGGSCSLTQRSAAALAVHWSELLSYFLGEW